jgi:HK97 gp10 family phage protein
MSFVWNGEAVIDQAMAAVDRELGRIGGFLVDRMQGYAPVESGNLKAGIHEVVNTQAHFVTVFAPAFYSIYQEFGTRYISPHPFMRPAILDAAAFWDLKDVTIILHPAPQKSEPIRATTSGFRLPRRQQLTPAQVGHVNRNLRPVSRSFAGKFKRRKIGFRVIGPK